MAITTADVCAAADTICGRWPAAHLAAVRTALGGGSFTTISEAMRSRKAAQQAQPLPCERRPPPSWSAWKPSEAIFGAYRPWDGQ